MTSGPAEAVAAWADAWRRLDGAAVFDLFTADATYVAALSGPLRDLRRGFLAAARTWEECRLEDFAVAAEDERDDVVRVEATYRFVGITRRGTEVTYPAVAVFGLRPMPEGWRIESFSESFLSDDAPDTPGGGLATL